MHLENRKQRLLIQQLQDKSGIANYLEAVNIAIQKKLLTLKFSFIKKKDAVRHGVVV